MQCVSGVITSHPEEEDEEGHLFWSEKYEYRNFFGGVDKIISGAC